MKYVCPDCGYESAEPGDCPSCETPLLRREDEVEPEEGIADDQDEELEGFGEEPKEEW